MAFNTNKFTPAPVRTNTDDPDSSAQIIDEDGFGGFGKDGAENLKQIILRHIRKISDLSCKEFTPSFYSRRPVKVGEGMAIIEEYHPDLRMGYINAVEFLVDMMMPDADDDFKKIYKTHQDNEEKEFKVSGEQGRSQDDWVWTKLAYRRRIFAEIMLMIKRTDYFGDEVFIE